MKHLVIKGCAIVALAFTNTGRAAVDDGSSVMLQLGSQRITSQTVVRVKVFPHERNYPPQGLDSVRDQITVRSERPCSIYSASPDRAVAQGPVTAKEPVIALNAAEMQQPVMIHCPGGFTLERKGAGGAPNFTYEGRLYVRPVTHTSGARELEAINLIGLREYLRGVVPSEVYREWAMEALKTQAVAARTYAVYHLVYARRFEASRHWDVDDTINYQAYTGTSLISERTDIAVRETDGQILTYHGKVIQAYYHADSGGQTEEALAVWSQSVPFTVARPEVSDMKLNKTMWEKGFTLASLTHDLRASGALEGDRSVRNIVVPMVGRTPTGRVRSLAIIDHKGRYKLISVNAFKRSVPGLPSNLFTIERDRQPGQFLVKGLGNGHGVGMSQMGAAALAAQRAWTYKQILEYYYVRTTLCSLDGEKKSLPDCGKESEKFAGDASLRGSST
ncbi:MAG TPA: SpoIID/LytB domain-containing protein [Oligoflexus sp.]|uniref:SpoIID/LytB domain-containing protein n=1 Tax=Oligoflexus sp. TaxID=1971216 RepID=UPI002D3ED7A0|nr:SpoIID/LytB domain-containing protein [Oligoflexus sp.]HYX36676.1 SpoIID/LytB domain-containing protein [Oligoflexus sp.]